MELTEMFEIMIEAHDWSYVKAESEEEKREAYLKLSFLKARQQAILKGEGSDESTSRN